MSSFIPNVQYNHIRHPRRTKPLNRDLGYPKIPLNLVWPMNIKTKTFVVPEEQHCPENYILDETKYS